jgi:ligand-binding sensor domain-containing protein/two-component sensor histidine kinase
MALLLLSLGAATFCYAQTSNLPFKTLNRQNGLLGDLNAFIFRDSRGFMWLSSVQGLNRFDGKNIQTFVYDTSKPNTLWGNNIQSPFFEDKKGDVWFCTEEAINVYRRQRNEFDHFYVHNAKGQILRNDYYIFDLDTLGFLWLRVGNYKNGELYRFNTLTNKADKTDKSQENNPLEELLGDFTGLRTVVEKTTNNTHLLSFFWGGKYGIEDYQFDKQNKLIRRQSYFSGQAKDGFSVNDTFKVKQIVPDSMAKGFWVATQRGLVFWNKKEGKYSVYNDFDNKKIGNLTDIIVKENAVWVSSRLHGVLVFDKKNQQFIRQILPNRVNTEGGQLTNFDNLFLDKEDNLWLSSFDNGLFYTNLKRPKFGLLRLPATSLNISNDNIIEDRAGNKWIVKRGQGITVVNQHQEVLPNFFSKNLTDYIIRLYRDRESVIWALTVGQSPALHRFNPQTRSFDKVSLANNQTFKDIQLYDICQISDGRLLVGTSKGVFELDKSVKYPTLKKCRLVGTSEADWNAVDIFEDSHKTIYVNQNSQTLLLCRLEGNAIQKVKEVGVNGETVSFVERNNKLWLASNKGLMVFDHDFEQLTNPQTYLLGFSINGLLTDSTGHFWLTTPQGIVKFNPSTGNYKRFSMADMMQGYNFGRSALIDKDGQFWFGGTNGINIFKPSEVKDFPFAPRPHIIDIHVNNKPYRPDSSIIEKKRLVLPYDSNTVRLDFAAVEFSDNVSDSISYSFHLANTPDDQRVWTTVANAADPSVNFVNLREGSYVLQIKAVNSDGVWSAVRTLELDVLPPWYRTWTFYGFLFALIATITYFVVRRIIYLREKVLKEKAAFDKKMKETELKVLRSQMNPHFIFNALNAIRDYVLKKNPLEASMFLADFAHLMREILNNSTKETISIEKEEEILRGYLEMEQLRFDFEFDIQIDHNLDAFDTQVPTMILQPFVENAILHGIRHKKDGTGRIKIRFDKDGDFVLCTVEDNGIGMAKAAENRPKDHESKSQQITQDRLDILTQLSGKPTDLYFEEVKTGGTKVTVKLPL